MNVLALKAGIVHSIIGQNNRCVKCLVVYQSIGHKRASTDCYKTLSLLFSHPLVKYTRTCLEIAAAVTAGVAVSHWWSETRDCKACASSAGQQMLNDSHRLCAYYPVQEKHAGLLLWKGMQQKLTHSHRFCAYYLVVLNCAVCTKEHAWLLLWKGVQVAPIVTALCCSMSIIMWNLNAKRQWGAWLRSLTSFGSLV